MFRTDLSGGMPEGMADGPMPEGMADGPMPD